MRLLSHGWRCASWGYWTRAFLASLVLDLGREAR